MSAKGLEKNWMDTLENVAKDFNNPQQFWEGIKRLKGTNTTNQHLEINNEKLLEDQDKERAHRELGNKYNKITAETNRNYDQQTEREEEEIIRGNANNV